MAGFAADSGAIRAGLLHSLFELPSVRIGMATRTKEFIPVVRNRLGLKAIAWFVTIAAGDCHVAPGQNELGLFVPSQRERGWFVSLQVVASLTTVEVGGGGKLSRMLVGVAVSTALELDLEQRVFTLGDVAARALHHGVTQFEGISRCGMVLHRERGWFESIHGMAGGAFAAVAALGKLAGMWVRPVAVHALLEGQRLLEICAQVTLGTFHYGMFTQQWILGCRVIETLIDRLCRHFFPSAGVMACLAALGKASAMRIRVTIRTLAESDAPVARPVVRPGRVTFLAGNLCVQAGQGVVRPRVIELAHADRFPIVITVALKTILAQLPLVRVLVARNAVSGKAKECLIQIGDFDGGTLGL
jgi:hypothetical protein